MVDYNAMCIDKWYIKSNAYRLVTFIMQIYYVEWL